MTPLVGPWLVWEDWSLPWWCDSADRSLAGEGGGLVCRGDVTVLTGPCLEGEDLSLPW